MEKSEINGGKNSGVQVISNLGLEIHLKNALDYGCGAGRLSEALSETFDHVTGVDFSQNMLNLAKAHSKYKNLNYEKVNGKDLSNFPNFRAGVEYHFS